MSGQKFGFHLTLDLALGFMATKTGTDSWKVWPTWLKSEEHAVMSLFLQSGLFCGKGLNRALDELRNSQSCGKSTWLTRKSSNEKPAGSQEWTDKIRPWVQHPLALLGPRLQRTSLPIKMSTLKVPLSSPCVWAQSLFPQRNGCPSFIVLDKGQSPLFRLVSYFHVALINPDLP